MTRYHAWLVAGVAAVLLVAGIALSHLMGPAVRFQKVTLAGDATALKFVPAGAGPHQMALLGHGNASSKDKETPSSQTNIFTYYHVLHSCFSLFLVRTA